MTLQLEIINPIEFDNWDNLLLANGKASFFHTTAWAKVVSESYNYKPLYFAVINENQIETLVPLMEVNSIFTGRRGVSLPSLLTQFLNPFFQTLSFELSALSQFIEFTR